MIEVLSRDQCEAVRREAVNSLLGVGPVASSYHRTWRTALDNVLDKGHEKDKGVLLWVHVCIVRNDANGPKGNADHLDAVAKHLTSTEPGGRLEACQALGYLGEDASGKLQDLINVINKETVPTVVAAAIVALTNMPKESAITLPILRNVMATHSNKDVKKYAEEAIKALTAPKKK